MPNCCDHEIDVMQQYLYATSYEGPRNLVRLITVLKVQIKDSENSLAALKSYDAISTDLQNTKTTTYTMQINI